MSAVTVREWYADVPRSTRVPTVAGVIGGALAMVGFGAWASTALIAGAVVTTGAFVATGQNKIVQHLEGGMIRDILVREGDIVEQGQTLIRLDETHPRVELQRLLLRHARAAAMEARFLAEIRGDAAVRFPPDLLAKGEEFDIGSIIDAQRMTFEARRKNVMSEISALEDSIKALQERIAAGGIQIQATDRQLALIDEEHEGKNSLLSGGMIRKPEVLALRRAQANLQGEIGRLNGEIGDSKERIARTREQITGVRAAAIKDAVEQMHQVRAELTDLRERIRTAHGILERIDIVAPVRGIVVKLRYHTSGGVIEPGKNVLELVPLQEELIIEVRIRPQDIEHVKIGHEAAVRLTALNRRITPMLYGHVTYVSADALPDDSRTPQAPDVYVARIKLDPGQEASVPHFRPKPGMPAEVYIKTEERTFFEYLMKPIIDSMSRAFREY
jgi:HlyD family type I secretion membrane fusion protein